MQRHARPIAAPPAKKGAPAQAAGRARPQPAGPRRSPAWHAIQLKAAQAAKAESGASSRSGLPAPLKAGVEALSGLAMDDVRVHRNSSEPAKLGALAYAKGSDIHLGPGQERHLPHEAWHIVQQKQGRVAATAQLERGPGINDDADLEREADRMGAEALRGPGLVAAPPIQHLRNRPGEEGAPAQLLIDPEVYPTRYVGPLTNQYRAAVGQVVATLNHRVDDAYQQSLQWQTLANHDAPHVQRWHQVAANYAANPDQEPRIISARFGYSIETIACAGLNNSVQQGLTIATQVAHGHTRPDVVLSAANEEIAWIDITSAGSVGHIRGKEGAGWASRPFVYELVYPKLELRALLNATNDPYYAEVGGLLAGERQIELDVKEAQARGLRDTLIELRDENEWSTGTGNAGEKRRITRDAFHIEAASDGVEEETESMKHTRGALEELGINPGPYGFNRGNIGSTNRRVNELIAARASEEIAAQHGQLHTGTTLRIMNELQASQVPLRLQNALHDDFWVDPTARETTLAAMALKGVAQDIPPLAAANVQIQAMNAQDPRVQLLARDVGAQLLGPETHDFRTILAWRQEVAPLLQRTQVLAEVDQAIQALHQYAQQRNMVFFGRPPALNRLLEALAPQVMPVSEEQAPVEGLAEHPDEGPREYAPPNVLAARMAMAWLNQQLQIEAQQQQQQLQQQQQQQQQQQHGQQHGQQAMEY